MKVNHQTAGLILIAGVTSLPLCRKHALIAATALALAHAAGAAQSPSADPDSDTHERAEQELRRQERQRILRVIPNFNTSDVQDAAPLSGKQKFRLALRSSADPFTFVTAGIDAGLAQNNNEYLTYGQGGQGYAKRFAAAYADTFSGTMFAGAVFPSLLHQDPRYFRKGSGSFFRRVFYSLSTSVRCKDDKGRWVPNYSNILGNLAAGGLANAYYPASDRGIGLTYGRALSVLVWGAVGSTFIEFWPDISSRVFRKR
jgi:hypothetical protein